MKGEAGGGSLESHPGGDSYKAIVDVENIAESSVPNYTFN